MTSWAYRVDTRSGDMAHGITFKMWERSGVNVRGEGAHGQRKVLVNGRASLTLALNQYKYGDELIAQVFSQASNAVVRERRSDGYSRVQIYLGTADEETARTLESIAAAIRERLRGETP